MKWTGRQEKGGGRCCDINKTMLCWSTAADSNSKGTRQESQKPGKSRAVCDRGEKTASLCETLRHLTSQVKRKRRSKMRKVEVATQKGRVKIHLDSNWREQRKTWCERKARHLQASNHNSCDTAEARCTGTGGIVNMVRGPPSTFFGVWNLLNQQKVEIKCVGFCLCANVSIHTEHCEYWVGKDNTICCCDYEFQMFCKQVKGYNYSTLHIN